MFKSATGILATLALLLSILAACGGDAATPAPATVAATPTQAAPPMTPQAAPTPTEAPTPAPATPSPTTPAPTPAPTEAPAPTPTATPTPEPPTPTPEPTRATPVPRRAPAATPKPTPVPTPTPTPPPPPPAGSVAEQVYAQASPAIAYIETPVASGSGVLIEGGYIVTNHHVVIPYEEVRITFPDGTDLQSVPLVGWDPMADLAVFGPVTVAASPLTLAEAEDAAIGSEMLLIGYPAEVDEKPVPTITRGILSRLREWERLGMTYLQSDAAIAGGQSGGALLNSEGEVIGISGISYSEAGFALSASAADVKPIVDDLIKGRFTSGLGDRRLPAGQGDFFYEIELVNLWDDAEFIINATAGTILEIEVEGDGDAAFFVSDVIGPILEVDDELEGLEFGSVELLMDGAHLLNVAMYTEEPSFFQVYSNVRMKPLIDPDDGRVISPGRTIAASIDHPLDYDWFSISLEEGETVAISTDSLNADTEILVDFLGAQVGQIVSDYDSGGGLAGTNAHLVYRAPHTGEFTIVVREPVGVSFGGYYLTVETAREGTETVVVPPASTTPVEDIIETSYEIIETPYGRMYYFMDELGLFEVLAPADWEIVSEFDGWHHAVEEFDGGEFTILYGDVDEWGLDQPSLDALEDAIIQADLAGYDEDEIISNDVLTTLGVSIRRLELLADDYWIHSMIYLSDDWYATISYFFPVFPVDQFTDRLEMVEDTFDSFFPYY